MLFPDMGLCVSQLIFCGTFLQEIALKGRRIGYVRVSSFDQNPEHQLEPTQVDKIFTDTASGKDIERPELAALLALAQEGDTVVVHSMDRLAHNLDDLRCLVQKFTKRGVRIEFVKESLTFTGEDSPMASLMLSVMGAFAEFERALIRERQREGIALAKQRGAYRGRVYLSRALGLHTDPQGQRTALRTLLDVQLLIAG